MINIDNGYHLLVQIIPSAGDDWIDHSGNQITQIGFTTGTPSPVVYDGDIDVCLNAVYDCDLYLGELSRSFENFPINPLERLADFNFSITGVWSDPDGNINTSNFLWMIEDINKSNGKTFNLIGREIRVIISTTAIPGLFYNSTTFEWEQVGTPGKVLASLLNLPIPTDPGAYEVLGSYRIENIKFGGSGRIDFDCTSLFGDVTLGQPVAFAGADQKQIKPIVYGDFTTKLAPVAVEKTLDKISRLHLDESTLTRFDALMVYDKSNDTEWEVISTINRVGTKIDFNTDFDTAYNSTARAENSDSWIVLDSEKAVLPTTTAPEQKLFKVDTEVVGFHSPLVSSITIDGVTHSPLASRGWGDSAKEPHAQNAPYRLVDAVISENSLVLDIELLPVRIYDTSETLKAGDWHIHEHWGNQPTVDYDWNCTEFLEIAGNPWAVIANSKQGGDITNPIIVSTSSTDGNQYFNDNGHGYEVTECDLIFEFFDLSALGGVVQEANLFLDVRTRQCLVNWFDNASSTNPAIDTGYDGYGFLTVIPNSTNDTRLFYLNSSSNLNTVSRHRYSDGGWQIPRTDLTSLQMRVLIVPDNDCPKPYLAINALKIKAKLKVPITSDLKICSKMLGRLASTGNASTSAIIEDMIDRYLDANTNLDFTDGHPVSVAITAQTKLRDVLRDVALAGTSAITQAPSGRFVVTQWGTGGTTTLGDEEVILGENNQPAVSYSLPIQSSVYSSFEIRYGWDHMREKYTRSLVVNPIDFAWDGIKNDSGLWTRGSYLKGLCQYAAGWLGLLSSPFVYESKIIQDSWTAEDMTLRLVEWLTTPRMTLSVKCDWSKTQSIGLLDTVSVVVTGLPQRIATTSWSVIALVDDLKAMERTFTLIERP